MADVSDRRLTASPMNACIMGLGVRARLPAGGFEGQGS
jgi:hypothetical protein